MDRELYTDSFEQLLKEQADKFTMKPTQRVWHGIYNDLHPGRRWPSIAIGLLLVASILLLGYFNTNGRKVANYTAALAAQDKGGPTAQTEAMPAASATAHANGLLAEPLAADPMRLMAPTAPTAPAASPVALLPGHALLLVAPVVTNRLLPRRTSRRSAVMALQNHGRQSITVQSAEMGTQHHDVPLDRNPTGQRKATDNINEGYNEGLPPNGSPTARSQTDQQVLYVASEQIPADADNFQPGNAPVNELSQTVKSPSVPVAAADATASPATTATPLTKAEKKQAAKAQGYRVLSEADKAWIDHDVLYNQRPGRKWKNKLGWQAYLAPSVTYRTLFENSAAEGSTNVQSLLINPFVRQAGLENTVDHRVGLGMELGGALVLQASPKWQFRLGAQFNYNSYQVMANKVGHPVNTAITLNNLHTGELQLQSRSANTSNTQGANQNPIKNYTVQLSLPVGFAYKLAGKNALKLYAGASLQPSFVLAGSSPLLSSDRLFYVENGTRNRNTSLMRNFNLALGFETFASYRLGEYTLSAGPQLRYQLLTTNSNRYTIGEKVYNVGLRIGVSKLF